MQTGVHPLTIGGDLRQSKSVEGGGTRRRDEEVGEEEACGQVSIFNSYLEWESIPRRLQ